MIFFRSRFRIKNNVSARLFNADGTPCKVFNPNALGVAIWKATGKLPQIEGITGAMSDELNLSNIVTDAGRAAVASRIGGLGAAAWTRLAIGTDSTAPNVGQTALGAEITTGGGARVVATVAQTTTDVTNDTLQLSASWTFSGTFAVNELGVFNAASGGNMLSRMLMPAGVINVTTGMVLAAVWKGDID